MRKSYHIERHKGIATPKLPTALSREIGRVIVHWAHFEYCVQEMVWGAMKVTPEMGRIAVREPRAPDRLEMLRDVIRLRGAEMDWDLHKSILVRSKPLLARRDLFAHAIWFHHAAANEWLVQVTKGNWSKELEDLVAGPRKIIPESLPITVDAVRAIVADIDALTEDLKKLRKSATIAAPKAP